MKEYAIVAFLLLTLCSVSSFKIYFPEERNGDDSPSYISEQMTRVCVQFCLERLSNDFDHCQKWCLAVKPSAEIATSTKTLPSKRQVDPLLSCIEARCAGVRMYRYGGCVYENCILWQQRIFKKGAWNGDANTALAERPWTDVAVTKRSWNDVMQTCIEYNCGGTTPGSFEYNVCVQQSCSTAMFGKR